MYFVASADLCPAGRSWTFRYNCWPNHSTVSTASGVSFAMSVCQSMCRCTRTMYQKQSNSVPSHCLLDFWKDENNK